MDTLRRALGCMAWRDSPSVRLQYIPEGDVLVARFLPLDGVRRQYVHDRLCVDFDGDDRDALPTALAISDFLHAVHSPADRPLKELLGDLVWRAAVELSVSGDEECEVFLDPDERDARLAVWQEFARRPRFALGVEVSRSEIRAVLVDDRGVVLGRASRKLAGVTPGTVAGAVAQLADRFRRSHDDLVVGVAIGGPVHRRTGTVYAYRRGPDPIPAAWENAPLGELIERRCGARAVVLNDVDALAVYERWFGLGTSLSRYGVLLVSEGIGGALVKNGEIDTAMPLELGTFVVHPGGRNQGSVESTAAVRAIVERVRERTGRKVPDLDAAINLAERADTSGSGRVAADVFHEAGRDLGAGVATVQALANPSEWAIYLPPALRTDRVAAVQFRSGLENFGMYVSYKPYRMCTFHYRSAHERKGARGAALAALEERGISSPRAAATRRMRQDGSG